LQSEEYSRALGSALKEIKNLCPDLQASVLFDKEGTIIASDGGSSQDVYEMSVESAESLLGKSETIGGLDSLIINAQKGKLHISSVNNMYLTLVATKNADASCLQMVSRVLVPTVIKLLDNMTTIPLSAEPSQPQSFASRPQKGLLSEEREEEMSEGSVEEQPEKPEDLTSTPLQKSPSDPREPSNQLIVDTLGGLLVRGDTVQIDADILQEWSDYYDGAEIVYVEIESFSGNSAVCKVKPIRDSKVEGKRIVRIPERACQDLAVKKGEIVKVKPSMEQE